MKGWTVKAQVTKNRSEGIAAREIYLHNKNAESHQKTEAIGRVWGNDHTMAKIAHNGASSAAKLKAKGKGGRPSESYAMEFTLNLPKGYRPTGKQWKDIAKQLIIDVASKLNIPPETLSQQTYAVVHRQDQTIEYDSRGREVGTGDHMHVVIGKFTPDGECLRNLQRKTVTNVVKDSFNSSTMKIGFDWTQYRDKRLQAQDQANRRSVPTWKVKAAREIEAIAAQQAALDEQSLALMEKAKELEILESNIEEKIKEAKQIEHLKSKFANQAEKWLKAFKEQDLEQQLRQRNRMERTIGDLNAFTVDEDTYQFVESLLKEVNSSSDKPVPSLKNKIPSRKMKM